MGTKGFIIKNYCQNIKQKVVEVEILGKSVNLPSGYGESKNCLIMIAVIKVLTDVSRTF